MTHQDSPIAGVVDAPRSRPASRVSYEYDQELVELLRVRSPAAWETLFERHFDRICRYALARTGSKDAAEEIAAGTFQRALASIDGYSYRGKPLLAWLYGIARNILRETYRKDAQRRSAGLFGCLFRPNRKGEESAETSEQAASDATEAIVDRLDMRRALHKLTPSQRDVIIYRYYSGLSVAEISQALDKPETAVYALQARGLASLRRHLADIL